MDTRTSASEPGQGGAGPDTFPRWLMHHAKARPQQPAMREKEYGIWQTYTWAQVAENVRAIACGLAQLGFKRGDRLAVVGDNRPRLYWSVAACQCLGGIPVMMYQDAVAQEMAYVLQDAEIKFAVVEDQEQVDKMVEIQPDAPLLAHVIYDDPRGMRHYTQTLLMGLDELQEMGRIHDRNQPDFLDGEIDKGASDDISIMLYTSGTTGKPKGVCQTHGAFIAAARGAIQFDKLTDKEDILSYLPMAWVGDHLFSFAQATVAGFTINCPESGETVMTTARDRTHLLLRAAARVREPADPGDDPHGRRRRLKRKIFRHFMDVARRCGADILDGKPVSGGDRFQYALGNLLVYGPLRNVLGMSRIRVAYTAGAAIGPGPVPLLPLDRHQPQAALRPDRDLRLRVPAARRRDQARFGRQAGTLRRGQARRQRRDAGQGADAAQGVLQAPRRDRRVDRRRGLLHTGDAGFFDADGHLKIIDRAKDVGKLADGTMFAPNYIENKLKFFPHIKEAVAFGAGRDNSCAFVNIDIEAVGNWAEKKGIAYSGYTDLAQQAEVYELIRDCVEKVNADLAAEPNSSGSQIHRFLILHKELDADDGELTRTRKVRRGFIAEKYAC
jgi:long-chain acyl-CoA synthetase